jgi:hypothetical protein
MAAGTTVGTPVGTGWVVPQPIDSRAPAQWKAFVDSALKVFEHVNNDAQARLLSMQPQQASNFIYNSRTIDYSYLWGSVLVGAQSWLMTVSEFSGQVEGTAMFTGGACGSFTGTASGTARCPITEVNFSNVADPYSASIASSNVSVATGSVWYPSSR